jgi:putative transposase
MDLTSEMSEREACGQGGHPRAAFRRRSAQTVSGHEKHLERRPARRLSSLALDASERQSVLDAVHEPRFVDRSVPHIFATLLDEGIYHCSMSTMYRILHGVGEVGERRDQAIRPAHVKPELCATAPRQVFAWDITKLHGPQKWTYFYLYAIIDIYSRYVVGWRVADRERSDLARILPAARGSNPFRRYHGVHETGARPRMAADLAAKK